MLPRGYIDEPSPRPETTPFQGTYLISGCGCLVERLDKLNGSVTLPLRWFLTHQETTTAHPQVAHIATSEPP